MEWNLSNKSKSSKIKPYDLCLGNISKGFYVNYTKRTGFYGHTNKFSFDYNDIKTSNITNICKYLIKKNNIALMSGFSRAMFIILLIIKW